ncbi:hypothetical protein MMC06_001139 [Schaereria dolodes]|nr:hypothetical protein [Schaereria dolodes]
MGFPTPICKPEDRKRKRAKTNTSLHSLTKLLPSSLNLKRSRSQGDDELVVASMGSFCQPRKEEWSWNACSVRDKTKAEDTLTADMQALAEAVGDGLTLDEHAYPGILEQLEQIEREEEEEERREEEAKFLQQGGIGNVSGYVKEDGWGIESQKGHCVTEAILARRKRGKSSTRMLSPLRKSLREHLPSESEAHKLDENDSHSIVSKTKEDQETWRWSSTTTLSVEEEQIFFDKVRRNLLPPWQRSIADEILRRLDHKRAGCNCDRCKVWSAMKLRAKKKWERRHSLPARVWQGLREIGHKHAVHPAEYVLR